MIQYRYEGDKRLRGAEECADAGGGRGVSGVYDERDSE